MKRDVSETGFADLIYNRRKEKASFFAQINRVIDWAPIARIINSSYSRGKSSRGCPSYEGIVLFKIELLRTWYGLSDGEVEEQVNDRLSFSRFAGVSLNNPAPDSTTVCRFRSELVKKGVYEKLLNEINRQLEEKRILVKKGVIVDASVTDTPRCPNGKKEYEVVRDRHEEEDNKTNEVHKKDSLIEKPQHGVDTDGNWLKKMGKYHYGFKRHEVVDDSEGLIIAVETTSANESDIKHLEEPLKKAHLKEGTTVEADKGYKSKENDEILKRMKLKNRIMHKGARDRELTQWEKKYNKAISKTRYKVERTFGSMRRWFDAGTARYIGLAKTHAQHLIEAIAYNLYRTPGIIVSKGIE